MGWRSQFQVIYQDFTERKQAEEKLKASRLQLRALYKQLQKIREEERLMVAREIHDEMGGGLTGLKMDISWLLRQVGDADQSERARCLDGQASYSECVDRSHDPRSTPNILGFAAIRFGRFRADRRYGMAVDGIYESHGNSA